MKHKFRAWDKENKCMVYQEDMNGQMINKPYWFSLSECEVELLKFDEEYKAYCRINADIMQYTGLKDKNGIEIYEGDLLIDTNDLEEIGKVFFEEGCFQVQWDGISENLFENCDVYEVVGNIYENSELLGGVGNERK